MCMCMRFPRRPKNKLWTGLEGNDAVTAIPKRDAGLDSETGVQFGLTARAYAAGPLHSNVSGATTPPRNFLADQRHSLAI